MDFGQVDSNPNLVVFDLDHTLWPFRVDKNTKSPFHKRSDGQVIDSEGKKVNCVPNVRELVTNLKVSGFRLAIASRIKDICGAYQLLEFFGLSKLFLFKEIYEGSKIDHFFHLKEKSGVNYSEMLFFDDDKRNVRDVSSLGVIAVKVPDCGITEKVIEEGMRKYVMINNCPY